MMNEKDRATTIEQMKQANLNQVETEASTEQPEQQGERREDIDTRAKVDAYKNFMANVTQEV